MRPLRLAILWVPGVLRKWDCSRVDEGDGFIVKIKCTFYLDA